MRHLQNFRGCKFSLHRLFTRFTVGCLINRPSPHRSPDKLITFTSMLFLRRVYSASQGKEQRRKHDSISYEILRIKKEWRLSNKTISRARKLEEIFSASRKNLIYTITLIKKKKKHVSI